MDFIITALIYIFAVCMLLSMTVAVGGTLFFFYALSVDKFGKDFSSVMADMTDWKIIYSVPATLVSLVLLGALFKHFLPSWMSLYTPLACATFASSITYVMWVYGIKREHGHI